MCYIQQFPQPEGHIRFYIQYKFEKKFRKLQNMKLYIIFFLSEPNLA